MKSTHTVLSLVLALSAVAQVSARADDELVTIEAENVSVIQHTKGVKLYFYPQTGDLALRKFEYKDFRTLDECMSFKRPAGEIAQSKPVWICDGGKVTLEGNELPSKLAAACAKPALKWFSALKKNFQLDAPQLVMDITDGEFGFPATTKERGELAQSNAATLAAASEAQAAPSLQLSMFALPNGSCEAHYISKPGAKDIVMTFRAQK